MRRKTRKPPGQVEDTSSRGHVNSFLTCGLQLKQAMPDAYQLVMPQPLGLLGGQVGTGMALVLVAVIVVLAEEPLA